MWRLFVTHLAYDATPCNPPIIYIYYICQLSLCSAILVICDSFSIKISYPLYHASFPKACPFQHGSNLPRSSSFCILGIYGDSEDEEGSATMYPAGEGS